MIQFSKGSLGLMFRTLFKKVNAPYKLSIINEQDMNESVAIHLTKKSVFVILSSLFVGLFLLFSLIIFFTPLKYYLPGTQSDISRSSLIKMQKLSDSLIKLNENRERYIYNLIGVANGNFSKEFDSNQLSKQQINVANAQNLNKIDKASRYEYLRVKKIDSTKIKNQLADSLAKINEKQKQKVDNKEIVLKKDSL